MHVTIPIHHKAWNTEFPLGMDRQDVSDDFLILFFCIPGKYAFLLDSAINDYTNSRQPCNTMRVGPELNSISYGLATSFQSPLRYNFFPSFPYIE